MEWHNFAQTLITLMGFKDFRVEVDNEHRHGSIFFYDDEGRIKEQLPFFVESLNHYLQLIAQKHNEPIFFFDVNNYRKERENLITELAKAAARKVMATKTSLTLPPMNSYERRLVHMELATHPEIRTESEGDGKKRYVVIKLVEVTS